jgi:hypothetical protein
MSAKERERMVIMRRYTNGELLLKEAAWEMGVSTRQAIRIKKRWIRQGPAGLIHLSRDVPSNRRSSPDLRPKALRIYRERYTDFGPTLACEKLAEREGIRICRETLRRWLIAEGLWRVGEKPRVHRMKRKRRARFGQLLQIDGSEHAWFEGRAPKATLMVLIDDATGRLALHMARSETTRAALTVLRKWVARHGVPAALYADRRTVYFTEAWVQHPERRGDPQTFTQFMRCAERLGIELIPAYSPQAKGRVERANGTLQDRLVKELRLRGISTIEAANAMLDHFAQQHNRRFAKEPRHPADAHRSPPKGRRQWEACFSLESIRRVQRDHTVALKGESWQILPQPGAPRPGDRITWREPLSGTPPYWHWREHRLKMRRLGAHPLRPVPAGASPRAPGI